MNKTVLFVIFSLFFTSFCLAQSDPFHKASKVSWLGVDFSHVKLIGDFSQFSEAGAKNPEQIRNTYFKAWNDVILNEREKYDVAKMVDLENIYYDIDMVYDLNSKTDPDQLTSYNEPNFSKENIQEFVRQYTTDGKEGIGIVFIADALNKGAGRAIYHFAAFDMNTKEMVAYHKIVSRPRGFGLRNYWAGSIYDMIKQIRKKY